MSDQHPEYGPGGLPREGTWPQILGTPIFRTARLRPHPPRAAGRVLFPAPSAAARTPDHVRDLPASGHAGAGFAALVRVVSQP
ncbi:hypothetical protein JCM9533A_68620 [Catenuloplanes niger JCM 9533]